MGGGGFVADDIHTRALTSRSASDPDYDISTEDSSEMKTKIHTLKLPVLIHQQTQKQKAVQSLKSAGVRQSQSRSELDQVVIS